MIDASSWLPSSRSPARGVNSNRPFCPPRRAHSRPGQFCNGAYTGVGPKRCLAPAGAVTACDECAGWGWRKPDGKSGWPRRPSIYAGDSVCQRRRWHEPRSEFKRSGEGSLESAGDTDNEALAWQGTSDARSAQGPAQTHPRTGLVTSRRLQRLVGIVLRPQAPGAIRRLGPRCGPRITPWGRWCRATRARHPPGSSPPPCGQRRVPSR